MSNKLQKKQPIYSILWFIIRESVSGWVSLFIEYFFEPILFGFGLVLLYSRLQPIFENNQTIEELFTAFRDDMVNNPMPYLIFAIIFFLWAIIKMAREIFGANSLRDIRDELKNISTKLGVIDNKIDKLNQGDGHDENNKSG